MSVQFPRDSPLQLNQGIPTGGRRRPLAGEDLVKVVRELVFLGSDAIGIALSFRLEDRTLRDNLK